MSPVEERSYEITEKGVELMNRLKEVDEMINWDGKSWLQSKVTIEEDYYWSNWQKWEEITGMEDQEIPILWVLFLIFHFLFPAAPDLLKKGVNY